MTRTPFPRVLDAALAAPVAAAKIGALALVPTSRPTTVAALAVTGPADDLPVRTSPVRRDGRRSRADRGALKVVPDLGAPRVGPAPSGGGPPPEPGRPGRSIGVVIPTS